MNKPNLDETVSALLDDALDRHEVDRLLAQLADAPKAGERLARYALISMAMRGELAKVPARDMTSTIMARIRAEKIAPAERFSLSDRLRVWLEGWRLSAAGLALVAGVIGGIVGLYELIEQAPSTSLAIHPVDVPLGRPASVLPLGVAETGNQDAEPDPYLVQHLTHAESGPMMSMGSNVRLVAYEHPE